MHIIPAIDLIGGKCVRLSQGDYSSKKEYHDDPLEMAKRFEGVGIQRLHLVDLDGAKAKKIINADVLERICSGTSLQVDFGGGIQADNEIEKAFSLGATQVTGGSIAVKNPSLFETWISTYGAEKIILGADAKNKKIAVGGWEETTSVDLIPFVKSYFEKGIRYVICTDVAKDGLLQGPSMDLYREILQEIPDLKLIASGGVSSVKDLEELEKIGVYGTIVGKAYYEGRVTLEELASFG
ncbi:1-(5-phosphoribosyl)-5-[(5-phosphoribosylamino)methylideneamino]imidazole-4-carboxamide isomerase [Algoriphagus boritolerans]|uniref:1-(5-phosphoribosyl)-5-[(5-phosphoribosylamino)methylideneamino] imidazole-4-carboxamide isomerase n=1 Tax=Algoriphagus boritolerans DSM 17298 = JCM 18970 TaxID=1120964 RepID=A0A1H5WC65_9BACT|nr:1-(5-phosphoribosyl)-5-[(5-phosphoribosylamino)methylideneamino]imidazole-4-carboxamide isomerase [Algoriphagus boritolerans]SEF97062.1 1-(5-phosphoribosyl)-5-[(5-phosphoribosylamino)methylideneamino] imidazole-4-carboxamide isomerase [Algoriphagus boritolerans DSM 17298 = JCM 18970]